MLELLLMQILIVIRSLELTLVRQLILEMTILLLDLSHLKLLLAEQKMSQLVRIPCTQTLAEMVMLLLDMRL
jgi:hypothetical protein